MMVFWRDKKGYFKASKHNVLTDSEALQSAKKDILNAAGMPWSET